MQNNIQIFKNEDLSLQVRTIVGEDGSISFNAEDTARGFGWITVATSGNEVVRWNRINQYCHEFGFTHECAKDDYIPESLYYLLGMKASNEKAKKFQAWLATDVLPTLRRTGTYQMQSEAPHPNTIPADRLKALELLVNCPEYAIEAAVGIVKPFMATIEDDLPSVEPAPQSAKEETPTKKRYTSGYAVPFNRQRLVRHLKRLGWTAAMLSEKSGVDRSCVAKYLRGENRPSTFSRIQICRALDKPANWLNGGGEA